MVQKEIVNRSPERSATMIIMLAVFAALTALGLLFLSGRGSSLISGYNAASDSEKEKIDEKKLCRFMGGYMFVLAACWVVVIIGGAIGIKQVMWWGILLFCAAVVAGFVLANAGHRFEK